VRLSDDRSRARQCLPARGRACACLRALVQQRRVKGGWGKDGRQGRPCINRGGPSPRSPVALQLRNVPSQRDLRDSTRAWATSALIPATHRSIGADRSTGKGGGEGGGKGGGKGGHACVHPSGLLPGGGEGGQANEAMHQPSGLSDQILPRSGACNSRWHQRMENPAKLAAKFATHRLGPSTWFGALVSETLPTAPGRDGRHQFRERRTISRIAAWIAACAFLFSGRSGAQTPCPPARHRALRATRREGLGISPDESRSRRGGYRFRS
jgi:hypothetical protein